MQKLLGIFFLIFQINSSAQKQPEVAALNRFSFMRADTLYQFYAVKPPNKIKLSNDKTYYWYVKDTILITRGSSDGRILHGSFTIHYPDKNLKDRGKYKYGLKTGEWKSWYPGGELQQVSTWRNGIPDGSVEEFDKKGDKIKSGYYRNKLFTGYIIELLSDGKSKKVSYEKGKVVENNEKNNLSTTANEANQKTGQ